MKKNPYRQRRYQRVLVALLWLFFAATAQAADNSTTDDPVTNPYSGRDDLVAEGKTLFNIHCSHCHGPNAFQGERKRDLRRLSRRYKDKIAAVFYKTATTGRAEKGMPPWKDILEDDDLWKIFTFLQTVQKK